MADLYVCSHGATNPCDECKATRIALMFAMRKKLDPDAPDIIAFPEPESSTEKRCEIHGGIIGCPCGLGVSEREKIAREVERIYGPHDRRFKTAIEIADKIRKG